MVGQIVHMLYTYWRVLPSPGYLLGSRKAMCFFFGQNCFVAKMAIIHKEDLAKFGYELNMKCTIFKHPSIYLVKAT
jgi:hypothetical protein